jgi:hypothetical protein
MLFSNISPAGVRADAESAPRTAADEPGPAGSGPVLVNDPLLMSLARFKTLQRGPETCPVSAIRTLGWYCDRTLGTPAKMMAWIRELAGDGDVEVTVQLDGPEKGFALRIGSDAWPVIGFEFVDARVRICRKCGCTDELGCSNRCSWVAEDLCSVCVETSECS